MQSGSQPVGGAVVHGAKPEEHFEQDALHCPCHQASEEVHICHPASASLHSLELLISWQVLSQSPNAGKVVVLENVEVLVALVVLETANVDVVRKPVLPVVVVLCDAKEVIEVVLGMSDVAVAVVLAPDVEVGLSGLL